MVSALLTLALYVLALACGGVVVDRHPRWCDRMADLAFGPTETRE